MTVSISIAVTTSKEYQLSGPSMDSIAVYYNGVQVGGVGYNNRFIAVDGISSILIVSATDITSTITVTEYLRNMYDINDGQDTVLAYQPSINKWTSKYSYAPESFSMVSNRLATFKKGNIYIHESQIYNTFYGVTYDSIIAFPHNEAGNSIKSYDSVAVEGNVPDRMHIRTEVPNLQSSDLIASDFRSIEGTWYSPLYRDRLSPNTGSTDYNANLYTGDKVRGEVAKFQIVYNQPTSIKQLKFVDINYDPSRGQSV
jgi:hypothetical protein